MKLTTAYKELRSDIRTTENKTLDELRENAYQFIESVDLETSVVLIFIEHLNKTNISDSNVFLVSNIWEYLIDFIDGYTECSSIDKELNLIIFEFENYEDAFKYCTDYKEGY